ncbi:MAG: enoyl-CoA hydratase/isomerase family protein [Burkholderiales bacterium]
MSKPQYAYEHLQVERRGDDDAVLWVALFNPKARNALNEPMQRELIDLLGQAKNDASVRCLVLRGAGENFCSGGDIKAFENMTPASAEWHLIHRGGAIQTLMSSLGKPVIAAVEGWCLAGGTELALMCDFIYATDSAQFGLTEIRIGILPGWGGMTRLPHAVGQRRAREMIYRGEIIGAVEAQQWGLVNRLSAKAEDMYQAVANVSNEIALKSAAAVRAARGVIAESANVSEEVAMSLERGAVVFLATTPDMQEGVSAFLEKRTPKFNLIQSN